MDKNSFIKLCKTYQKLLLEIIDISLFFDRSKDTCRKVGYVFKDGKVEFTPIDKELEEVSYKLQRAGQSFRGYRMDSNKLVINYSTMMEWIGRIKETKELKDPLDIQNAILEEMVRQEKEKGLILETPGAGGKGKPAYHYVKQETKEGSTRVSKGILSGEKGKHTFTRLPALAMAEYIRASNKGVENPKDIEKSVIDNIPEWQKLKTKGQKPNTKYIKKAIKCGIKKATGKDVIPFNPIPFKISLDTK